MDGIVWAYTFASVDPYRAATHNKGIMNGVIAVVNATGNDTRAIEAGAHCYAARGGHYTSLTTWEKDADGNLVGTLEMPMAVGLVGGATKVNPISQIAIKILGVKTAVELGEIIGAVGLAQNLAGNSDPGDRGRATRPHAAACEEHCRHGGRRRASDRRGRQRLAQEGGDELGQEISEELKKK